MFEQAEEEGGGAAELDGVACGAELAAEVLKAAEMAGVGEFAEEKGPEVGR